MRPRRAGGRIQAAEDQFRLQLLEAKLRSEQRARRAAAALAVDTHCQPLTDMQYTPEPSPRFSLSPRIMLSRNW